MPERTASGKSLSRNSLALTVSAAVTGVTGLLYWLLAARLYPAREVGAASAVITTATMLAAFGNLSLGALFERFLPEAGARARAMLTRGFTVGALCGAVLGAGFVVVGPADEMFTGPLDAALFPLAVAILSGFALLDHTVVGLREAGWAATKNIVHSVAKLVALVAFAFTASRAGMVWTWLLLAAGCAVVLAVVVARRVGTEYRDGPVTLPPRREMRGFLAASYGIYVVGAIAPLVLPIVVIATLGAEANAYFAICWSLVSAVLVLMTMLTGPFVASVVSAPEAERAPAIRRETRRYVTILGAVAVAGVLGCAGIAPMLLGLLDPAYQEEGVPLLRIVAWAFPLAIVALVYNALARVTRRLRLAVGVQLLVAVVVLGGSALFLPEHGIRAIGWSYVVAEALAAVVLVVPLRRMLRSAAQPIGAASGAGSNSPSDSISRSSDSIGA